MAVAVLQHQGDGGAGHHEQEDTPDPVAGEGGQERAYAVVIQEHGGCFLQGGQAQEQEGEAHQELAEIRVFLDAHRDEGEEHQRDGDRGDAPASAAETQGEDPCGDGRADIGAHDDRDRASQGQQAGIDEAHDEERGRRRALHHGGDHDAGQNALEVVGGHLGHENPQPVSGHFLQTAAHQGHAIEEHGKRSEQG